MKLTFLGAAREVTGSCTLIEAGGHRFLVDCGMEQGRDVYENTDLPYAPGTYEALLLTHAHIDHSGRIPYLYKNGYRGPVYTTEATRDLCGIMLEDSAHIQEQEAEWKNRKAMRSGAEMIEPDYTVEDAQNVMKQFVPCPYEAWQTLFDGPAGRMEMRFTDVGHLLGSASITLQVTENGESQTIVFSGDIGNLDQPLIRNPQYLTNADFVVMESTYGNRLHDKPKDVRAELTEVLQRAFDRGGSVIIPAFAVGRTQELLYLLREIKQKKLVHGHDGFPVYLDSPLAEEATSVFLQCDTDCFDPETQAVLKSGQNPIWCPGLQFAITAEDSKAINSDPRPKVILSASGMCDAGRIRHHLKHNLWIAENIILIAGYQSKGTLGRALLDGVKEVRLFGEDIAVNAEIAVLHGTSGHADQKGLFNWVEAFAKKPETIFVNHGDTEACEAFQALLQEKGYVAVAPFSGAEFDLLSGKFLAFPAGRPIAKRGAARKKGVFDALIAAAQRLLLVAQSCRERPNRDLTRFTAQIQALIDRWEK